MKRSVVVAFTGLVLVACRAIVGIEDQTVGGDAGPPREGGAEAGIDSGTDAGKDSGGASVCPKAEHTNFGDCGKCCHDAYRTEFDQLVQAVRTNCICGKGMPTTCATQCTVATGDCGNGMVSQNCAPCIDEAVTDGTCPNVTCSNSQCSNVLACLRGCR